MSDKPAVLVVILFLIVALIYSSYSSTPLVSAVPSGAIGCERTGTLTVTCCQRHIINRSPANPAGILQNLCTDCKVGPGGEYYEYSERYIDIGRGNAPPPPPPPTGPLAKPLQPDGVLEQSPPPTISSPKTDGVLEQQQQQPQQPDQGITQTNDDNNNNIPLVKNKAKRSEDGVANVLEQQPQNGELSAKKRSSNNNDNSPTPPACPDKGPIPPDCTLKPKF
jgi:hypothetical protein